MDGWVFPIGDQRADAFGKGEVERHGNDVACFAKRINPLAVVNTPKWG